MTSSAAALATAMPALTLPVIETICRDRMADQRRAGLAVAADDVEHALGQELGHQLGHPDRARGRGVGRLEHHRVAGRQRRRPLPDGHHRRVVPGRHRGAHADRLAPHVRRVAGHVLAGRLALEHARRAREEADLVAHRRHFLLRRELLRLARVLGLDVDQLVGARLDRVGDPVAARAGARTASCRASSRRRAPSPGTRRRRRPRATAARSRSTSPVLGSISSVVSAVGGGDALAVDEVGDLDGHRLSSGWQ